MTVILSTWEAKIRRIAVQGQPAQKVPKTPISTIAGHGDTCLSSQVIQKAEIRRIAV
jgi:hypothetical protein